MLWAVTCLALSLPGYHGYTYYMELNVKESLLIVQEQVTMVAHMELNEKELLLTVCFIRLWRWLSGWMKALRGSMVKICGTTGIF